MELSYMTQLILSVIIFAPGMLLVAVLGFIGLLMLLERSGILSKLVSTGSTRDAGAQGSGSRNPEPGRVVSGLKDAVAAEGEAEQKRDKAASDQS